MRRWPVGARHSGGCWQHWPRRQRGPGVRPVQHQCAVFRLRCSIQHHQPSNLIRRVGIIVSLPCSLRQPPVWGSYHRGFLQNHPAGPLDTTSATDVHEADPMGSFLFALVARRTLKAVKLAYPQVVPLASHDTYLIGSAPEVAAAFPTLIQSGEAIKLRPSLQKCQIYGTPDTPAFNAAP